MMNLWFQRISERTGLFRRTYPVGSFLIAFIATSVFADESEAPIVALDFADSKESGPRSPAYPEMTADNMAGLFASAKDAVEIKTDHNQLIQFRGGDSITMEAWVKIKAIGNGHMPYLIGRGRHSKGSDQNYAMRLQSTGSGAQLGFLFTSENADNGGATEWHRWWSSRTLSVGEWHHVAIVYTFGKGDSLRGYIDGRLTEGTWDMGGETDLPPVVKKDADLVIGTGYLRGGSQTFNGWMDQVKIHREPLPEAVLKTRFTYIPPPPQITKEMLTDGKVFVQISEKGIAAANTWPETPMATEDYLADAFGFFDWPQKYISTGVRADRMNPSHFRASAMVEFPKGKHRLLLRGRGATRLTIDGERLLENSFPPGDTGGHGYLSSQDNYLDLGPDFRFNPPGNREKWVEFESDGGKHFVILETMIGGYAGKNPRRPEFGETVVAVSFEGSETWDLLTPTDREIDYTDEGWAAYEAEQREWLKLENFRRREVRMAEKQNAEYWAMRRKAAKKWLAEVEPVAVPDLPKEMPAFNAVDHFIGAKIAKVAADSGPAKSGGVDFYKEVKPILEAKCYDCHKGGKIKGGLRLDSLAAALKGGKYDGPAVKPGDVDGSSILWRIDPHEAGDDIMPPKGDPLSKEEVALLTRWVKEGAAWPEFDVANFEPTPLSDELVFLRRLALDTVGVPPSEEEITEFLADPKEKRRGNAIERFLADDRWADHWMGYWQDVLAENPNIINPTLNNTGPFRWWIHEALLDNKPADLFVTELVQMEGSERFGGPAGFGTASNNDVPMAAKGIIVSSAFLGVEMKCARCHDAPAHESKQEDLFQLAAMLKQGSLSVPKTSSVPMDKLHEGGRKPLIQVTLQPGAKVEPGWPFDDFVKEEDVKPLVQDGFNERDRLAALVTAPQNERFSKVMANRIWQRLMGRGLVESLDDWEKGEASHPELLSWLGRELVRQGYDMKKLASVILNSHAYQRATDPTLADTSPLYVAPAARRLSAEQVVDSLFSATGTPFELEEVSLDIDSVRVMRNSITLGKPRRAWMLASTSNERDRPSLSLPRITAVTSIMETFGWRGARQDPTSVRDTDANVLQPAILANGTMGVWLTRLSNDHEITSLAMEDQSVEDLVNRLYRRLLTRDPSQSERDRFVKILEPGYDDRIVPESERPKPSSKGKREPERYVSWSNHLDPAANALAVEREMEARKGDEPTEKLRNDWRLRMEDVIWALLNAPEWIYTP